MGLNFRELVVKKEISLKDLADKTLAIDTFNLLYQFLTTIRNRDGSLFTDSQNQVTSHLIGLFNRTTKLMELGIKPIFVFDGKPPEIKQKTKEIRAEAKRQAQLKYKEAEEAGKTEEMYKFSARTAVLTSQMIEEAKGLINLLGCPTIQAPSEGEAQCANLVKKGKADYAVSQDYDSLIFGCPALVRNLSVEGKRKKPDKFSYQTVQPEIILLSDVLNNLGVDLDQLRVLAILVGTDYNPGGIKGIGPKTALKLVKESPSDFEAIFQKVNWMEEFPDLDWKEIFYTIKQMPLAEVPALEWKKINKERLTEFLVKRHDFSEERVKAKIKKIGEKTEEKQQKGLNSFFH